MNDLFQPFRQLEEGRAGTGLYVSKLCITALSGEIFVYSEPTGTTFMFYVTLPTTF
ncbi:MAG TPA: ATP-binding protein [Chitinophaga sp.]|uniref:ATP-binding protein n=1 Tax=Chitinophaga sp. TaxID=1869181 RepID=UPI002CC583B5|nr:ATP-binding protein [Chitinophaga sp.]HVI46391.1 ATP-binding protein [Chitinophaga sp.]